MHLVLKMTVQPLYDRTIGTVHVQRETVTVHDLGPHAEIMRIRIDDEGGESFLR